MQQTQAASAADPSHADDETGDARRLGRWVIIGAALVVLAIAGLLARQVYIDDATEDDQPGTPGGATGRPGIVEAFGRKDGPLGRTDNGHAWELVSGGWEIDDEHARLIDPDGSRPRNIAVVDARAADLSVDLLMRSVQPGAGLVFGYENPLNYWMLTAAPSVGTWNVQEVSDGEVRIVGNVGDAATGPGTVIGVRLSGGTLIVLVDGAPLGDWAGEQVDPTATRVGLVNPSSGRSATFDDLVATVLPAGPSTTEPAPTTAQDPAAVPPSTDGSGG